MGSGGGEREGVEERSSEGETSSSCGGCSHRHSLISSSLFYFILFL